MEKYSKVIQFLMDDHKRIKGLFRQFEGIDRRAHIMKAGVCREIFMELEIHFEIKETIFYPTLQIAFKSETLRGLVAESSAEIEQIQLNLQELRSTDIHNEDFNERMNDLIIDTEQHFSREETEIFAQAQDLAHAALEQIIDGMTVEKTRLLAAPQYRNAQPEKTQNPQGGEQKRTHRAA
jgi:hypothetical protein